MSGDTLKVEWKSENKPPPRLSVLVVGGLGFIGSHLCRQLVQRGHRVRIFDKLYASTELITDIEEDVEIIAGDIARTEQILDALDGIEQCFYLAHTTVPGSSMENPCYDIESNLVSAVNWLSKLKNYSLKRITYMSSGGTVYGKPLYLPIDEKHPTNPSCSYGITKLAIEKYISMYSHLNGFEYRIARPSNAYGPGQRLGIGQGAIGVFVARALRGETIEIWGDGSVRRDFVHVSDIVEALLLLMDHQGEERVFNISSAGGVSISEIVEILSEAIGSRPNVNFLPHRGFDVPVNILCNKCLQRETGWFPAISLHEGIAQLIDWLRQRHQRVLLG